MAIIADNRQGVLKLDWSPTAQRQRVNLHLVSKKPPKAKRAEFKSVAYNPKTRTYAIRRAREAANRLGHQMTRFGFDQKYECVQSKCRKCKLMLEDFNFVVTGPALEYECLKDE